MTRRTLVKRMVLVGVGVLAVAVVGAPFLNAARFRGHIRDGLERGLHRKVEVLGDIRFTLFPLPGFKAENVLIAEDPKAGIEPFAHVSEMSARLRPRSLWTGRLEFSSLRLTEPSVNLTKTAEGPWNIQPFLARAVEGAPGKREPMPDLEVRGGRLNFKFGDTKSVFYLANADVDISSLTDDNTAFSVRFEGEPARTDRAARNFGRISGRGKWTRGGAQDGQLNLSARWERSPMAEFSALWFGRDAGVHGHISGETKLEGSVSDLRITGKMLIEDVHRWDLMPAKGEGWPVPFRGRLSLRDGEMTVETTPEASKYLEVKLRVASLLSDPHMAVLATMREMPVAPLAEIAKHLGARLPQKFEAAGTLNGAASFTTGGVRGGVMSNDLSMKAPGAGTVQCAHATLTYEDGEAALAAPRCTLGKSADAVSLSAGYSAGEGIGLSVSSAGVDAVELRNVLKPLLGAPDVALLEPVAGGRVRGHLEMGGAEDAQWAGKLELQQVRLDVPGLAGEVVLEGAAASVAGARLDVAGMRGHIGKTQFTGDYHYEPKGARPHRLHVQTPALSASEAERIFLPLLARRRGLIARTLRLAAPPPEWLKSMRAEGTFEIGSFTALDWELRGVHGKLIWDGATVRLRDIAARVDNGTAAGVLTIDLTRPSPAYQLEGSLKNAEWRGGRLDGEGAFRSAGLGDEVAANAAGKGCMNARGATPAGEVEMRTLAACFAVSATGATRMETSKLEANVEGEALTGRAVWKRGGPLTVELTDSAKKTTRFAGTVSPWKMDAQP